MNTDTLHSPEEHKQWNESFYFNWYDKNHDICSFTRIGLTPNSHQKNMFLFFMLPDGKKIGIRGDTKIGEVPTDDSLELTVNNLTFSKITNEKEWTFSYEGKLLDAYNPKNPPSNVQFKLTFTGLHPIFDYRDCPINELQEKLSKNVASEHLEQYGHITGKLTVEDKTYEINALGERDHSWGIRNWTAPKQWIWLTGQFNKDFAFNITKLTVTEGEIDAGFIHVEDKTYPIKHVTIDTAYSRHHEPILFNLSMITTEGKTFDIQASVKDKIHVPFTHGKEESMMYENLAKYTYKNIVGYGIAEYLIKQ